ncbi:MAG: poly-beta-1,6-N-acetyl-D-glucosamine biosynthesis protein PgaD [Burkholderiales bacterium]|nr:poly-beta-1,6-N-acetyl-D-glucosamine biosynthesis protein PgaD [Burkholderiales bacterium]
MRRPLIIERPDLQTGGQRWLSLALTLLFWLFYIYLWLPLVTLAGWAFGLWRGYDVFLLNEGYRSFTTILLWYAATIALFSAMLIGWALYNGFRFRGRERRRRPRPLDVDEQARYYGVEAGDLEAWRREKTLVVTHDPLGRIVKVTPRPAGPVVARPVEVPPPPSGSRAGRRPINVDPAEAATAAVLPLRRSARRRS